MFLRLVRWYKDDIVSQALLLSHWSEAIGLALVNVFWKRGLPNQSRSVIVGSVNFFLAHLKLVVHFSLV